MGLERDGPRRAFSDPGEVERSGLESDDPCPLEWRQSAAELGDLSIDIGITLFRAKLVTKGGAPTDDAVRPWPGARVVLRQSKPDAVILGIQRKSPEDHFKVIGSEGMSFDKVKRH